MTVREINMPKLLRAVLAIAAGFVVWFVVATIINFAVRWLVPGYADVEKAMTGHVLATAETVGLYQKQPK